MANSILDGVMAMVTPEMKQALAARLGESSQGIETGLGTAAAATLGGLASKVGDTNFLSQIINMVSGSSGQNILGSLSSLGYERAEWRSRRPGQPVSAHGVWRKPGPGDRSDDAEGRNKRGFGKWTAENGNPTDTGIFCKAARQRLAEFGIAVEFVDRRSAEPEPIHSSWVFEQRSPRGEFDSAGGSCSGRSIGNWKRSRMAGGAGNSGSAPVGRGGVLGAGCQ